jgi:hypothetical protein
VTTATDGLALYRAWLERQVEEQKARIQTMSTQYSIPIPNLDLNTFDELFTLPLKQPAVGNAFLARTTTTNATASGVQGWSIVKPAPRTLQFQPAHSLSDVWRPHGSLTTMPTTRPDTSCASVPMPLPRFNQVDEASNSTISTTAAVNTMCVGPKKESMAYKTTPCRHFTLNRGWGSWGDDCCL